jgi:hypothetical protein
MNWRDERGIFPAPATIAGLAILLLGRRLRRAPTAVAAAPIQIG